MFEQQNRHTSAHGLAEVQSREVALITVCTGGYSDMNILTVFHMLPFYEFIMKGLFPNIENRSLIIDFN